MSSPAAANWLRRLDDDDDDNEDHDDNEDDDDDNDEDDNDANANANADPRTSSFPAAANWLRGASARVLLASLTPSWLSGSLVAASDMG